MGKKTNLRNLSIWFYHNYFSYLFNRFQYVHRSTTFLPTSSMFQDSFLGPIFFYFYINTIGDKLFVHYPITRFFPGSLRIMLYKTFVGFKRKYASIASSLMYVQKIFWDVCLNILLFEIIVCIKPLAFLMKVSAKNFLSSLLLHVFVSYIIPTQKILFWFISIEQIQEFMSCFISVLRIPIFINILLWWECQTPELYMWSLRYFSCM